MINKYLIEKNNCFLKNNVGLQLNYIKLLKDLNAIILPIKLIFV